MKKMYRLTIHFETLYTHEKEQKIEYTESRDSALRAFSIYIENPEVKFCSIDIVSKENDFCKKIIACYTDERG